jgi:hypothetical protein
VLRSAQTTIVVAASVSQAEGENRVVATTVTPAATVTTI